MNKEELYKRDYRDISYFVKHVKDTNLRVDILRQLGYKLGVDVAKKDSSEMTVIIGKKNEKRIQITPIEGKYPLVMCVILES